MSVLSLITTTRALLTASVKQADPANPGQTMTVSFPCDLTGAPLAPGSAPIPIYRDLISGNWFAQIAEKVPAGPAGAAIQALNPVHFQDDKVNGLFIPAPDFNDRVLKPAAPPVVAAQAAKGAQTGPVVIQP